MKWRVTVLLLLASLALSYRGMAVYTRYFSPELSTRANFRANYQAGAMVVNEVDFECRWPGERKELCTEEPHPGDRIQEIYDGQGNGGAISGFFDYGALLRPINASEPWTMVVDRRMESGESKRLTFAMPPAQPFERTTRQWLIALGFDIYLPLLALAAALIIGLMKPKDKLAFLAALLFLGFATSFRQEVSQFPIFWREVALLLRTTAYCFAPYLILKFFLRYPDRSPLDRRAPWLSPLFLLLASGIYLLELAVRGSGYFSFALFERVLAALSSLGLTVGLGNMVFRIFAAVATLLSLVSLTWNTVRAETRSDRRRMIIILMGALAGLPPFCALYLTETGIFEAPFGIMVVAIPLIGLFPLSFVYAIAKYRIFGIKIILRRGLKYALVSRGFLFVEGVLIFLALYFAAGPLLAGLLPGSDSNLTSIGIAAATLGLVAGTRKLNRLVVPKIDRRFFRDAYDTRRILTELGRAVRRLVSRPDQLLTKVADEISAALHPDRMAIFLTDVYWPQLEPLDGEDSCLYEAGEESLDAHRFRSFLHRDFVHSAGESSRRSNLPDGALLAGRVSLSKLLQGSIGREPETMEVYPLLDSRQDRNQLDLLPEGMLEEESLYRRFDTQLVVPLATAGRVIGFMLLGEKLSEEPYTREDKELLLSVAEQVATALDYCQLICSVAEQRELRKEIQIAQDVQARLFPQERPPLRTLDYTGDCRSAHGVGGDYYDFLALGPSHLGITVADIAGKGLSASLLMASLQALVRSHAPSLADNLREFAREVNRHLCESTDDARFATLFFGIYDDETRTLRYLNAGHNPPILIRAGGEIQRLGVGGMVLGLFEENRYEEGRVALEKDDLLVIFSDGIVEAANRKEEQFGDAALVDVIKRNNSLPPGELLSRIAEEVDGFAGPVPPADDMTLIVARVV
jgi:sigma-B regulation protein RsbU (phosphoserine phosphatase)